MRLGREGRTCDTGCKPIVKYMFAPEQCSVNTPSNLEKTSTSLRSSRETSRILKDITFSSWRDIFALIGKSRAPIIGGKSARTWSILCTLVPKPSSTSSSSSRKVPWETTWSSDRWAGRGRSDGYCCCWHPPRPQQHPSWTYRSSVDVAKERFLLRCQLQFLDKNLHILLLNHTTPVESWKYSASIFSICQLSNLSTNIEIAMLSRRATILNWSFLKPEKQYVFMIPCCWQSPLWDHADPADNVGSAPFLLSLRLHSFLYFHILVSAPLFLLSLHSFLYFYIPISVPLFYYLFIVFNISIFLFRRPFSIIPS